MHLLFTMDQKDYSDSMPVHELTTVRALIRREGRYAMQRSTSGVYKIPGGGVDPGETLMEALVRETAEEMGLFVLPESVREIGSTIEIRRDVKYPDTVFCRKTLFYGCRVTEGEAPTHMTSSEIALGYRPVWATIPEILRANQILEETGQYWQMRDTLFMRWLEEQEG